MTGIFSVLEQLFLMGVLISLGFYLNRFNKINQSAEKGIAELTIDIAFPALIFTNIIIDFDLNMLREYLIVPAAAIVITLITIAAVIFIGKKLSYSKKEREEFTFITAFSNNIFVGAPICLALFGSQGLILAILYDFGMQIILWTLGVSMLKEKKEKENSNFLGNMFSPPIIALLIGLVIVLLGIELPQVILNTTNSIGVITVPLAMIFIGLQLGKSDFKSVLGNKKIYLLSFLRLIFLPGVVYFSLGIFSLGPLLRGVITILSAMPVFASSSVILQKYGRPSNFASEAIFATILFMGLTLPIFVYLTV
ncbi:AEC family transporter [Halanaerobium hydrogeniformans]|uniref:Auxin Efflux Carrier n=1 Tax=Halanaerobium hydrogeniformans TaxID=656519 RepID=E4RL88_HALHG|nr:AEC family transporter [Halanaerobium hydrogeniformans]ADQ15769.1 Auxin Efflux Carrier [Halanaerobium hydrogeniformans]